MNIFLAAIIFSFFAVFAPTSHGDRPLLHADQTNGEIAYSNFKLPIARLQSVISVGKSVSPLVISHYFTTFESFTFKPFLFLPAAFSQNNKLLSFHTSPFVFCEILQV